MRVANEVRAYLAAMEARISELDNPDDASTAGEWLDWCRTRLTVLDPLEGAIRFPEDPEPSDEALRPFLPDWMRRRW